LLGSRAIQLEIEQALSIGDILELLLQKYPKVRSQLYSNNSLDENFIIALNKERVETKHINEIMVHEGDEIAILPPAGGG
jgi:MoaD family protein